jgi:hypothetical protein
VPVQSNAHVLRHLFGDGDVDARRKIADRQFGERDRNINGNEEGQPVECLADEL